MSLSFTWHGHSAFSFESDGKHFIIDPFLSNNPLTELKPEDVQADYILLTHAHGDHTGFAGEDPVHDVRVIQKHNDATIVCNFEMGNWFTQNGISEDKVFQGNPGGTMRGEWLDVKWTVAHHSSAFGDGSYGGQPNGMIIRAAGVTIYHAGDTALFSDMALIGDEDLDVAMVPIGDVFTMGVEDSIKAVKMLKPRLVVPMHYNTFPPIVQDVAAWADTVNRETKAQPIILDPNGSYTLE